MRLFDPDPKNSWLFCFTHPDDEISICAWMRRLVLAGATVWAGWSVTNAIREAEARRAMESIGVSQDRLFFFGFPDQCACDHLPDLVETWRSAVDVSQPDQIAVGAFECGHIDHDSTNFALRKALESLARADIPMLEIPWYHTYLTRIPRINRFADPSGEEVLTLEPDECKLKWQMARMYPSQNIASLLVWYTVLNWVRLRPAALRRTERMRLQTHFDYTLPNLPADLTAKVMRSPTWKRWKTAIDQFESS